jgi:protein-S-isoprenylcysteine O-methyltransferase Ste14
MLPFPDRIVAIVFIIMGIGYFLMLINVVRSGGGVLGKPSIRPVFFYAGKISQFICWGFCLVKALDPSFLGMEFSLWLRWTGTVVLCIGTALLLLSFYDLGTSLKYGIPESSTQLKTKGIYRYSRHPLYLGVYLLSISSIIYFPNILNILMGLCTMSTHYMMILAEERFLAERFGKEWDDYKNRVPRFLFFH